MLIVAGDARADAVLDVAASASAAEATRDTIRRRYAPRMKFRVLGRSGGGI